MIVTPKLKNGKDAKATSMVGATTGGLGAGFATCHAVCQSLVSVLAVLGVTLLGMPLAFLEPYSAPLLILSAVSFGFSIWLCKKHKLPLRTLLKPVVIGFAAAAIIVLFIFSLNAAAMSGAAVSPKAANDKCAAPVGYTNEQWREHMGHHPDIYAECLR